MPDVVRLVEIIIWPLVALCAIVVVGFYHLARLAITGKGMQQRAAGGERGNSADRAVGFPRG